MKAAETVAVLGVRGSFPASGGVFLEYGGRQAVQAGKAAPFSPARREELLMSVWLHDIGKLVTPLEVMNKAARLLPEQYSAFIHRMEVVRLRSEIEYLSGRISAEERDAVIQRTRQAIRLVDAVNGAGFLPDECLAELDVFDALVADDRPYKPGMPIEKALSILRIMAEKEGKLDPELTERFCRSKCWEKSELT